jgi:hypothetical protein
VNCGTCPNNQTCKTPSCNGTTHLCEYTNSTNGQPGTNCTTQCCNGVCCAAGQACVNGICVCNAASCPSGCCSNGPGVAGTCQTSNSDHCGTNGVTCTACGTGQTCVNGTCVCNATSCPNGCCSNGPGVAGTCVPFANQGAGTCGTGGATCAQCPTKVCNTATCTSGVCGFTPLNEVKTTDCTGSNICCNGFCVTAQLGQCPICCHDQSDPVCPNGHPCVGSGACGNLGQEVCAATDKCCQP